MQADGLRPVLDDYLLDRKIFGRRPRTRDTMSQRVGWFVDWLQEEGVNDLAQLRPAHIRKYLGLLQERGLSPWTVRTRYGTIRAFLRWCWRQEIMPNDVTAKVEVPAADEVSKPFLSEEQFARLEKMAKIDGGFLGARRMAMLHILITTGMRRSELAGLRLESLNWDDDYIQVEAVTSKGRRVRQTPFLRSAMVAVRLYLRERGKDKLPQLWVTEERTPLTVDGISTDLGRLYERAKVPKADVIHIFRRTRADDLESQDANRADIRRSMGWRSDRMVELYTRNRDRDARAALQRLKQVDPWGAKQGPRG